MKNPKAKVLCAMFACLIAGNAMAYDAKVGDIYYDFSGTEATVTYFEKNNNQNAYTGAVNIPATVTHDGKTYNVTAIGWWAFANCQGMTSVTIPNSVDSIASSAFVWCTGLTSINIPSSVKTIGSYAFSKCSGLTSLVIPEGVQNIDKWAFYECDALTSVSLPASLKTVGEHAFHGCDNLMKAEYVSLESLCSIDFQWLGNPLYYAHHLYIAGSEVTDLVIPAGIKEIGNYAFHGANQLKSIDFGASVEKIGAWAFAGCWGVTSNTCRIPDNVKVIEDCAFYNTNYHFVTIGAGMERFGINLFDNDIDDINIEVSKPTIAYWLIDVNKDRPAPIGFDKLMFDANYVLNDSCKRYLNEEVDSKTGKVKTLNNLPNLTVCPAINNIYDDNELKYVFNDAKDVCYVIGGLPADEMGSVSIPSTITYNGNNIPVSYVMPYAFYGCTQIKILDIACKDSIANNAFRSCSEITSLTISSDIAKIGDDAFNGCKNIGNMVSKPLTPPTCSKTSISAFAKNCKLIIYQSAQNAYKKATGWSDMKDALCPTDIDRIFDTEDWKLVSNVTNDSCYVLGRNTIMADVEIPTTVNYEGNDMVVSTILPNAFYKCTDIVSIAMDLDSIKLSAFTGCTGLKTVTLGSKIKNIDETAFKGCKNITRFVCKATVPPTCGKDAVKDVDKKKTRLFIPSNTEEAYGADESTWKDFIAKSALDIDKAFVVDSITYVINAEQNAYTVVGSMYNTTVPVELIIPESITNEETEVTLPVVNIMPYAFFDNTEIELADLQCKSRIGNNAFQSSKKMAYLTLGQYIDSIGVAAFTGCVGLDSIACMSTVPPACGKDTEVFKDVKKKTCRVSVPNGALEAYEAADTWNEFGGENKNIVERDDDSEIKGETNAIEEAKATLSRSTEVFDLNGRRLTQPRRGINLLRMSDGTVRKVLIK